MNTTLRITGVLLLLAVLGFCVFGFMATFEPLDASTQFIWRVVYGLVGMACMGGIVHFSRRRKHGP